MCESEDTLHRFQWGRLYIYCPCCNAFFLHVHVVTLSHVSLLRTRLLVQEPVCANHTSLHASLVRDVQVHIFIYGFYLRIFIIYIFYLRLYLHVYIYIYIYVYVYACKFT